MKLLVVYNDRTRTYSYESKEERDIHAIIMKHEGFEVDCYGGIGTSWLPYTATYYIKKV